MLTTNDAQAQTFQPTSGSHFWNVAGNWSPATVPNASGATATLSAPTGGLTINLGELITIGSLTVNKATSGDFDTTISDANALTIDGGTSSLLNGFSSVGTGLTIVNAPVVFNSAFTVTQGDNDVLDFRQSLSGAGGLVVNRNAGTYSTVVALSAENTYSGATTTFTGSTADDSLVVRLGHASALPATTNVSLAQSVILELAAGNFTRAIGTGAGEIQFSGSGRNGWGAFGTDLAVNLGGAGATVTWGTLAGQANFGQLVLGNSTSTATVNFQNPLDLGTSNRNIRSYEGTAAIDGKISGPISGGTGGNLTKINDGVLSLAAANTYTGNTIVQGGILRLDDPGALGSGNLQVGSGGTLGIGADTTPGDPLSDFARNLGTAAGEIQLTNIGTGLNQTNAGFSAHDANRSVVLNGGATLTWGSGFFLSGGSGTPNRQFLLSGDSANFTLDFKNPIDLAGANRTVVAKNGSAVIDARLSGIISGAGTGSGLLKDNPGTLELSNANTYGGITRVNQGVLLLTNLTSIPGGITGGNTGNIEINSSNPNNIGVIGLGNGPFTSPLGTGAGQFQIVGSGGFAAYGLDRVVNLGNASAQVTWGTGNFVSASLQLSAVGADAAVDFQNDIELGVGTRIVKTQNGTAPIDGILSGVISGAGILDKQGGGTLVLTRANTYDGGTLLNEGRLWVNNMTGSGVGAGNVTVNAGTLGGRGFIGTSGDTSNVTVTSATIAPGDALPGALSVFGDVSLDGASFLNIDLTGATAGLQYDQLVVDGAVSLGGATLVLTVGFTPAGTESFTLIDKVSAGGISGQFGNYAEGASVSLNGVPYKLTYTGGVGGNDVVLAPAENADFDGDGDIDGTDFLTWQRGVGTAGGQPQGDANGDAAIDGDDLLIWENQYGTAEIASSPVPEPAAAVLVAIGIGGAALARRRSAKAA